MPRNASTAVVVPAATVPADLPADPAQLTFIVTTPQVVGRTESNVARLTADTALHSVRQAKTSEKMAQEYLHLRRMFPADPKVQELLGVDAPDLAGRTPEYKAAIGRINESARDLLIAGLRKEGMTVKGATAQADQELETIRKSVTRSIRIAVENEAKQIMASQGREAAARFILGHGFGYSGEVTSKSYAGVIEAKSWKLDENGALALPEGVKVGEDGRSIVPVNPQAEPAEQSDQATPTETADTQLAKLLASAGVSVGDPHALINLAIGILDGAAGVLAGGAKLDNKVRVSLRKSLTSSVRKLTGELESTLPVEQSAPLVK